MAVKVEVQTRSKRPVVSRGGVVSTPGRPTLVTPTPPGSIPRIVVGPRKRVAPPTSQRNRTMTVEVLGRVLPWLTELPSSDRTEADRLCAEDGSAEARRRVVP